MQKDTEIKNTDKGQKSMIISQPTKLRYISRNH